MRKSVLFIKGLLFLIFISQILTIFSQDFGKAPFRKCWQRNNENMSQFLGASDNDNDLYAFFSDGSIESLDSSSGKPLWRSEIGGEISTNFTSDDERILISSKRKILNSQESDSAADQNETFIVSSLSQRTGITNWQKTFSSNPNEEIYLYSADGNKNLFVLTQTGTIYILNKDSGEVVQKKTISGKPSSVPFHIKHNVYFGTLNKNVISLSDQTGQIENKWQLTIEPNIIFAIDPKTLFVGDKLGNVTAINNETGQTKWKIKTGAEINSITKVDKGLLIASLDNFVYLVSERNGKRFWRRRLPGRTIGNPFIRDNVAVFSTTNGNDAIFIELKKGNIINRIVIPEENYFLNNPAGVNGIIVFPTYQGLLAYGSEADCKEK